MAKETKISATKNKTERQSFQEIFNELVKLLQPYGKKFQIRNETKNRFELWSEKEMFVFGKNRTEMFFAGATMQKAYVGFYYMPIYMDPALKKEIDPELVKTLKGKSCFHIKAIDKSLSTQIKKALDVGYKYFDQKGYV